MFHSEVGPLLKNARLSFATFRLLDRPDRERLAVALIPLAEPTRYRVKVGTTVHWGLSVRPLVHAFYELGSFVEFPH
jgi:hypothetical protein